MFFWKAWLSPVETHSHAGQTPPHCPLDRPEAVNSQELQGATALCR